MTNLSPAPRRSVVSRVGGGVMSAMGRRQRLILRICMSFIAAFGLINATGWSIVEWGTYPWTLVTDALKRSLPALSSTLDLMQPERWGVAAVLVLGAIAYTIVKGWEYSRWWHKALLALVGVALVYVIYQSFAGSAVAVGEYKWLVPLLWWLILLILWVAIAAYVAHFAARGLGVLGRLLVAVLAIVLLVLITIQTGQFLSKYTVLTFVQMILFLAFVFGLYKADLDRMAGSTGNVNAVESADHVIVDDGDIHHGHHMS